MAQSEGDARERNSSGRALVRRVSGGLDSLRGRMGRVTGFLSNAASQGSERAAEAAGSLRRSTPLRHGVAAAERGNLDAALALLREAVECDPDDGDAVLAFWNVARATDRAELASSALARHLHAEASAGRCASAVDLWVELSEQAPHERADSPTLVRMLPELRRRLAEAQGASARSEAEAHLLRALGQSVGPGTRDLTPGLALRVFEQARFLDAGIARRAGEVVLSAGDVHEAKRQHVEATLARLDESAPPARDESPEPECGAEPLAGEILPSPTARSRQIIEAVPIELSGSGLIVRERERGRRTRIDLRSVGAIAVVRIGEEDDKSATLVDLALRRTPRAQNLRIVRMQADTFDAREVLGDAEACDDPLEALLAALLDRSGAVPLPDPGGALGLDPKCFASRADYESEVLSDLEPGGAAIDPASPSPREA